MKNIVHVIDNLGRGGAETLLTDLLPILGKQYNIILVTLDNRNEFDETVFQHCFKHYCLNHTGNFSIPSTVRKLRRIINQYQPALVRSQLYWSTIISRMACPKTIPFVFSVHITMETYKETVLGHVRVLLEKATVSRRQTMIGVTKEVVDSYVKKFGFKGNSYVLYNYVRKEFFFDRTSVIEGKRLRLVAVGNLRLQKNYHYLVEAFKALKNKEVSLDIYGDGPIFQSLKDQIEQHSVAIQLKGAASNIAELLQEYDAFVMVSSFEGFGIAVAEAMAAGLPLILSGIPVLREVTSNNAFFIDLSNPKSFSGLINSFLDKEKDINAHVESNKKIAKERYTQEVYLNNLNNIYANLIQS